MYPYEEPPDEPLLNLWLCDGISPMTSVWVFAHHVFPIVLNSVCETSYHTGAFHFKFGRLNVVVQSQTQYVVPKSVKSAEYVARDTAAPSHKRNPVGTEVVSHIIINHVIVPFVLGPQDPSHLATSLIDPVLTEGAVTKNSPGKFGNL